MSNELDKTAQTTQDIQNELKAGRMSRRRLLDSLKVLGVGFGATYVAGADSAKAAALSLGSTNQALNSVIQDARAETDGTADGEPTIEQAQFYYRRFWRYRRFVYRRFWRYRRYWYRRW